MRSPPRRSGGGDVEFVVCGGVACILQGVSRVTNDIDLLLAIDDANLARFVGLMKQLGYTPCAPVAVDALLDAEQRRQWVENKGVMVFTLNPARGRVQIDVFLTYPLAYDALSADADVLRVEGHAIRVSSKRDLIEAKQAIDPKRKVDLRDIEDLKELLD